MIELFTRLWFQEPARFLGIVTGVAVVVVAELGSSAPRWLIITVAAFVYASAEITRSQVSPKVR